MKKVIIALLAIMVVFIAACQQAPTDNTQTNVGNQPANTDTGAPSADNNVIAKTGAAAITATFSPTVGRYEAIAAGELKLTAPLTKSKVEIYNKIDGEKKVVASVDLGDVTADETQKVEITLSKNRLTYKIGAKADSIQNGIPESKKTILGADFISGDVKANWESKEFAFDDSDAYKLMS